MKITSLSVVFIFVFLAVFSCREKAEPVIEETLTSGKAAILVDNAVQPVVEDVLAVFHNVYDRAFITQVNLPENEVVRALLSDTARVAVLSRKLTSSEEAHFRNKKIQPKVTEFAFDALALVVNRQYKDSIADVEQVLNVLRGRPSSISKLVFDSPGSGSLSYLKGLAGVSAVPSKNVFALKTNEDVLKYVHDNNGAIGVIGLNWLLQPPGNVTQYVENIKVLAIDNVKKNNVSKKYYKPNQSNIAEGLYPFTRTLYVLNYQGKLGLGMGFATYISAPEGQRIILKSGLMPVKIPPRELEVRNEL
ncbi:hypothetical protein CHU92_04710 [Flavobacterium cyanobacteriorum]|uniref:PBP domain-containing protein n=1 Tax=Flavobacterium cyanobacteriorum TaxID=2022802 RepID=A0A255ZDB2_9FLAO|nr:substrate-binding domain-containing protein [Flavobacterium cyanobacteriorum]OYQ39547.1 hypothetical protein CHU92_04710 [Flavobacterium cyanobacteriorum]